MTTIKAWDSPTTWSGQRRPILLLCHLGTGYYLYCFKNSICLYLCEQLVFKDVKDFICIERSLLITAVGTPPNGKNDYSFTRWFSGWNPPHGEETLIMPTPLYLLNKSTFEPHNNRYQGTITLSVVDCWPCSFTCITHSSAPPLPLPPGPYLSPEAHSPVLRPISQSWGPNPSL